MEPKITHDFFLLSLNPKNGYYYNFGNEFAYGLLGAIVMDLYRTKRISIEDKIVGIVDATPSQSAYLDRILDLLHQKGSMRINSLFSRIGFRANAYKRELAAELIQKKIIIKVRKKFLFIPYNRFYPADRENRMNIIRRVRDVLLRNEKPQEDELYLLTLIRITNLFRALSDRRDEKCAMRQKLKVILQNSASYSPDSESLNLISTAVKRAIIAANAAKSVH